VTGTALWRVRTAAGARLARGPAEGGPTELLPPGVTVDGLLGGPPGALAEALEGPGGGPVPAGSTPLAPVEGQEVWAAGVTFQRSRTARDEESGGHDHDAGGPRDGGGSCYDQVYDAERPELFLKAAPGRSRGPGAAIGIRGDSRWDVPEPELALVTDRRGEVVAYTIGDDVSSRSIEGENPLYLPQAKVYLGSCALGPCLVPVGEAPPFAELEIRLAIARDDEDVFAASALLRDMRRRPEELVDWLFRAQDFPVGAVLLTGTSIVPPAALTLRAGDRVTIAVPGLGELVNTVEVVPAVDRRAG
jgi:2-dehydro-3-deoxy-D-arabinonate dehydratase